MEWSENQSEKQHPTNGGQQAEPNPPHEEDDKPRVVDKRRFQRLLEGEPSMVEPIAEPPRYPSFVEELQDKLKASEVRLLEYAEQVREARQQMQSEIDAIRDRLQRNMAEQVEQGKAQFVSSLLEVLDNLKRAIQAAETTPNLEGLLQGIKATTALFERNLETQGVMLVGAPGESFDPRLHEAVGSVTVEPERDGLIVEVLQPGYMLGEATLIRPALVRVGQKD